MLILNALMYEENKNFIIFRSPEKCPKRIFVFPCNNVLYYEEYTTDDYFSGEPIDAWDDEHKKQLLKVNE